MKRAKKSKLTTIPSDSVARSHASKVSSFAFHFAFRNSFFFSLYRFIFVYKQNEFNSEISLGARSENQINSSDSAKPTAMNAKCFAKTKEHINARVPRFSIALFTWRASQEVNLISQPVYIVAVNAIKDAVCDAVFKHENFAKIPTLLFFILFSIGAWRILHIASQSVPWGAIQKANNFQLWTCMLPQEASHTFLISCLNAVNCFAHTLSLSLSCSHSIICSKFRNNVASTRFFSLSFSFIFPGNNNFWCALQSAHLFEKLLLKNTQSSN